MCWKEILPSKDATTFDLVDETLHSSKEDARYVASSRIMA